MGSSAFDLIGVVEAAYRLDGDEEAWLGEILDALAPGLMVDHGGCGAVFEREAAAGLRLRRSVPSLRGPDAVLSPGGKVLEATGPAIDARTALREAVRRVDHARSVAGRRDAGSSLEAWTALVDGRWSLVDHFESDGRRFVFALENRPEAPDPRALSPDERPILHLVAMGHSNKLVAYELGLPLRTVATRLASIMRKLGVRTRVEIVDRYMVLRSTTFQSIPKASREWKAGAADIAPPTGNVLTSAEAQVVALAARGASNDRIARTRGTSPRTVANLLARAYRKLGVRSRAELTSLTLLGRESEAVDPSM